MIALEGVHIWAVSHPQQVWLVKSIDDADTITQQQSKFPGQGIYYLVLRSKQNAEVNLDPMTMNAPPHSSILPSDAQRLTESGD